ncbi:MAG: glycyl-radical enzyme activating protein [Clostridia bacterium]|nr:glycyl-radical enzyme activating protein [Clostridia bacterium]
MIGTIFNIQKFSINDGPGIRTTVFLKGCPLHCLWCHNPESHRIEPELFYNENKCVGCRECARACPYGCHTFPDGKHCFDRSRCIQCGKCADICPSAALETVGMRRSVEDIMTEVLKDRVFYETSGGGMTVSGGEPMLQFDFTLALLKSAKEHGLHTCMETCGYTDEDKLRAVAPYVDLFLYDYKETSPARHKQYTGVSNRRILKNLRTLNDMGCDIVLRCPIIPTLNDRDDHFAGIATLASRLPHVTEINVEPYHPLGSGKAAMLGREYALPDLTFPAEETVQDWIARIAAQTSVPVKKA